MSKQEIWAYLYGNRLAIISAVSLIVSSAVKTAPQPGTKFNLYTWIYDWTHQFLNITNSRTPETPASPKV